MLFASDRRRRTAPRPWPIAQSPRSFVAFAAVVECSVLVWLACVLPHVQAAGVDWARLGLLAALALSYEEGGKRIARLQIRLGPDLTYDMTSVWGVAAAVALPLGMSAILLAALGVYSWFRRDRPAGRTLHRTFFNSSNAMLTSLVTSFAFHALAHGLESLPWSLAIAAPVAIAIVVHGATNRAVATAALVSLGVRGRSDLLGSLHDNLGELATLGLGGLVALAVLEVPWLAILAVAPMVSLQRGALVRELETAATTDSKTGLYNAVTWERIAQRELTRAARSSSPTAVMIIDLDRFKLVNDRFGHLAGDLVLAGVGRRLMAEVREYDTVGRFGGEEFVAVLPNASDSDALVIAERLRSRIHALRISDFVDDVGPEIDAALAVSIGVATTPLDGNELTELLYAADVALYDAKALGRNRVKLAERGAGGFSRRVIAS